MSIMARSTAFAAGLLLCCLAVASAAYPTTFLADTLANSKGSVKAKTASGYYGYADTEVACLQQLNFKSCRYTDCITDELAAPCPSTVVFQTDFTCCPKEEHYGHNDNIGQLGFSDKVGTCDWEISIYRWEDAFTSEYDFTPIFTDDGTALKYGTAWGTCYLNSEAEHCDDPLCERMAISIQGGLYFSLAYGDSLEASDLAPQLETCIGDEPGSTGGLRRTAAKKKTTSDKKKAVSPFKRRPSRISGGGTFLEYYFFLLADIAAEILLGSSPSPTPAPEVSAVKAPAAPATKPTKAKIAYEQETAQELYSGIAAIISGPFYETSKHDSKIEETGLFEFALWWSGGESAGTEPANRWPVVRARSAKLRFTREHEAYGHEGGSA